MHTIVFLNPWIDFLKLIIFQVAKSAVFAFERPDRSSDSSSSSSSSCNGEDEDGVALLVINFAGVSQRTALF